MPNLLALVFVRDAPDPLGLILILLILGSPLWISLLILLVPLRFLFVDVGLWLLQAAIAYFLWWFFWGGGIGGEIHLSPTWQYLGLLALLPVVLSLAKIAGKRFG